MTRLLAVLILVALAGAAHGAAQSGLPPMTVPDCLGVNIHFTGADPNQVDKIAEEGFRFIRMDFAWGNIESKKGEYDFKTYDELVASLATKGIRPLFIFDYGNGLYDGGAAPHTDETRAAFAKFAAAGAAHFAGKGVLWELWNEPNSNFWNPQGNVADYVKLAKVVYPALKKADPNCTVLAPALSGMDYGFIEEAFKLGLLDATDAVSLHAYGSDKPEDAAIYFGKVRDLIVKYARKGKEYPIVSGEWGYSSCSSGVPVEKQADYIAREFLSNMLNGCRLSIWYDWRDDGPNPDEKEHRFGTVTQELKPKPAFSAVKTLTTELSGYSFANRISAPSSKDYSPDDYLLLFKKGDSYRLAAWTVGNPHSISLPLDVGQVEIVSRSGERTKAEVKDGKLELKLTDSPQYIEPASISRETDTHDSVQPGLPAFIVPDCLGVEIHFTGTERKQVDQIADEGFKFIRMDFAWVHIEKKKGEYDFKAYDELIDSLASRGIRAYLILDYANPLYDNNASPHTDEGRAAFTKFAAAGAARYAGRGVLWELWNEPNGGFWRPHTNVEDYVKLCKVVYPALKKADPNCTVLAPALAGADYKFIENAFKAGLLEATDVVSLHAYQATKPEDAAVYYDKVRELIAKYAPNGREYPIVSGEWGFPAWRRGISIETQGDFIARQFLANMLNGCRLSIWYDWRNDDWHPKETERNFGTVYSDFKPKPAFFAAKTLTTELNGYSYASRMGVSSLDDYLLLFKKGDSYRLAAWTAGEAHSIAIPLDVKRVEIVSRSGERTKAKTKDGKLEIKLTASPQYIEPSSNGAHWAIEAAWNVDATTEFTSSGLQVKVKSAVNGVKSDSSAVSVSGDGVGDVVVTEKARSEDSVVTHYEYMGQARPVVTVTMRVDGVMEPITRVVELKTTACPIIKVLPSTGSDVQVAVSRPQGFKGAFTGKLVIGNADGIRFASSEAKVDLAKGEDRAVIHFKATQPSTAFSFATKLVDAKGNAIVKMPAWQYVVVESFADGKPGDDVLKYAVSPDGDAKVPCEAKLTYVKAPDGAPEDICAKLDYTSGTGWRFIRIHQHALIPIAEKPRSVRMWIKSDGNSFGRLRLEDAGQEFFQLDYGYLQFTDWRCIELDMTSVNGHWGGKNTGRIEYPIKWDTLFLLDNVGNGQSKGTIYLGPIMLCYD